MKLSFASSLLLLGATVAQATTTTLRGNNNNNRDLQSLTVTGFLLVDPLTGVESPLTSIDVTKPWNVEAISSNAGSVLIVAGSHGQLESFVPFALCGDWGGQFNDCTDDYPPNELSLVTSLTVTATPYSEKSGQGVKGTPLTVTVPLTYGGTASSPAPTLFPTPPPPTPPAPTPPAPTKPPTPAPTKQPTKSPTPSPSKQPTKSPTPSPSKQPTKSPTKSPTKQPTKSPTKQPTPSPTKQPTKSPTKQPTPAPQPQPTPSPTPQPVAPQRSCPIPRLLGDGNWDKAPDYPKHVAESQGALIGTDFVLVSGFNDGYGQTTNEAYYLDMSSPFATWQQTDSLPTPYGITHSAFVVVGTKLYMCGGYEAGHPGPDVADCLVYDHAAPPNTRWSGSAAFPDLPEGRSGGGLIFDIKENALVFAAGADRPQRGNADAYDQPDTWYLSLSNMGAGWQARTNIPFLGNHISFATAIDQNNQQRHYFFGGQEGENEYTGNTKNTYEYIVGTDTWIRRTDMPFTRGHASSSTVAVSCGFLVAGGSTNEFGKTDDISYYNTVNDTWQTIGNLPFALNTPVCAVGFGKMQCTSGWANGDFSYSVGFAV